MRTETIRFIVVIALFFGIVLPAETGTRENKAYTDLPVTHDLRPKFALFSWARRDSSRRFALIPNNDGVQEHRFIDKFDVRRTRGIDIRELEYEMTKLPSRCLVGWMKDEPHKLDYAEVHVVSRLKKLAARLHLDLQFNEMRYESTAVKR